MAQKKFITAHGSSLLGFPLLTSGPSKIMKSGLIICNAREFVDASIDPVSLNRLRHDLIVKNSRALALTFLIHILNSSFATKP